jgi:hypothetical protein
VKELDHVGVERLREAVYGTIIMLSVLAVLSEGDRSAAAAALTVAGTSLVLFFAQVYAVSAYDLTCRFVYEVTCRSRHADHCRLSPPERRVRRSLSR